MTALVLCPPAFMHVPEHAGTYGDEVADLAESVGLALDPEQRVAVDALYAHDARGRLVSVEFGCAAPRQNIKTHVGKAAALADLVLFDEPLCLWTAHLRSTAYEVFSNSEGTGLGDLFENLDHLRRLVDSVTDSDGEQTITLRRPAVGLPRPRLRFMTRSERGGRGLTGRRVTFDEALFLKPSMTSAMVPILSAQSMSGAVQVRYLGSPGLQHSAVWREVRDRGRAANERRLAWLEWTAPRRDCETPDCTHAVGKPGCALDDPELVRVANLAIGRRMDLEFVLGTERSAMAPADYMRERLGWWDDPLGGLSVISVEQWAALVAPPPQGRPQAFAVDRTPDMGWTSIGVFCAGHVDLVEHRKGSAGVVDACQALWSTHRAPFAVDPRGPAQSLIEPLRQAGVHVVEPTTADVTGGCTAFADAVLARGVFHPNNPVLDAAVEAARTRSVGDRWAWERETASALMAVTLAMWLAGLDYGGKGRVIALN